MKGQGKVNYHRQETGKDANPDSGFVECSGSNYTYPLWHYRIREDNQEKID